jgi:hypothetical protein
LLGYKKTYGVIADATQDIQNTCNKDILKPVIEMDCDLIRKPDEDLFIAIPALNEMKPETSYVGCLLAYRNVPVLGACGLHHDFYKYA